jgi:hypothetical protein
MPQNITCGIWGSHGSRYQDKFTSRRAQSVYVSVVSLAVVGPLTPPSRDRRADAVLRSRWIRRRLKVIWLTEQSLVTDKLLTLLKEVVLQTK